jgi:hypothetical protein
MISADDLARIGTTGATRWQGDVAGRKQARLNILNSNSPPTSWPKRTKQFHDRMSQHKAGEVPMTRGFTVLDWRILKGSLTRAEAERCEHYYLGLRYSRSGLPLFGRVSQPVRRSGQSSRNWKPGGRRTQHEHHQKTSCLRRPRHHPRADNATRSDSPRLQQLRGCEGNGVGQKMLEGLIKVALKARPVHIAASLAP